MKGWTGMIGVMLALALMWEMAAAEGAEDVTSAAAITLSWKQNEAASLTDGDYQTEWQGREDGSDWALFELPEDKPCGGLYLQVGGNPDRLVVETDAGEGWVSVFTEGQRFNTMYVPLDGAVRIRLRADEAALRLMEVRLYGPGDPPASLVRYTGTTDKADLMILACHPDDDILWMGGLIPLYAGQLGLKVQMAYMTALRCYRRCEAMDALWYLGVRDGPVFFGFRDKGSLSLWDAQQLWGGREDTARAIARVIRRYRPEVLVTQDVNGEYGHAQHRAMVSACTLAVHMAANPGERSLRDLPPWTVRKYYIHLYQDDALVLDMERPLSAFGGKSAYQLAREAFGFHRSQQHTTGYAMAVDGPYDMRRYGLAWSAVGPDEAHDGLFEHIDGLYEIESAFWHEDQTTLSTDMGGNDT